MFNEVDKYLLDRWDDVVKFMDAVEKLEGTYQELIDEAISEIKECEPWSSDEFNVITYPEKRNNTEQIYIYKKSWICGNDKWDIVGLGIQCIDIYSIMGSGESEPYACIWTERVEKKGVDLEKFNDHLLKKLKDRQSSPKQTNNLKLEIEYWGYWFYFPQSQKELLEAMKKGKPFIDILVEQFNTLSKFIDPIDKTIEKFRRE